MGFNNDGFEAALARLTARASSGILGVNFGPNKDASDRIADYVLGVKTFAVGASWFTINVSSPNTAGLRDLQRRDALDELVARVIEAREAVSPRRPVLIKIAPDLDLRGLDDIVEVAISRGADGLIVANTTIARPSTLRDPRSRETGGLSGRPLFPASTQLLARAYLRCEGALTLIGCGGIEDSGDGAREDPGRRDAAAALHELRLSRPPGDRRYPRRAVGGGLDERRPIDRLARRN